MAAKFGEKVPVSGCANLMERKQTFAAGVNAMKDKVGAWNTKPPIDPYIAVMTSAGYNVDAIKNFHRALYNEFNSMTLLGYIPVLLTPPKPVENNISAQADSFLF